jgi:hypothetical protein
MREEVATFVCRKDHRGWMGSDSEYRKDKHIKEYFRRKNRQHLVASWV